MNPRFPIYVISKGRADSRLTVKALLRMNVPFRIVVEESEKKEYASVIDPKLIITLDPLYQDQYDTCDDPETQDTPASKGSGPARNFVWNHAVSEGSEWHWIVDDNIRGFWRLHENRKIKFGDGTGFYAMEDFVLRYTNIAMAGPQYNMFVPRKNKWPPFVLNTRIFSCILIRNDIPYRWRCRYNEDLDLSLRVLKDGWCTILFNAFTQEKMRTLAVRGGNTDAFYLEKGTLPKSQMIVRLHPDVARLAWRFQRCHHHVDYRPFKANRLIRKRDVQIESNPYDLKLVDARNENR